MTNDLMNDIKTMLGHLSCERKTLGDNMNSELMNDIKTVLDITGRVDERSKMIQKNQEALNERLDRLSVELVDITSRVSVIESKNGTKLEDVSQLLRGVELRLDRVETANLNNRIAVNEEVTDKIIVRLDRLEEMNNSWSSKLRHGGGLIVQGVWVLVICYLLYKLGINNPPIP